MRKRADQSPVIVVEWRSASGGGADGSGGQQLAGDDMLAIARALGRLAARRDIARAKRDVAAKRLRSDEIGATMTVKAPA